MNRNQVIALSAILQVSMLVDRLATNGSIPNEERNPLLQSILVLKPESIDDVYDGIANIRPGLFAFAGGMKDVSPQAKFYFSSIIALEKSLQKNPETLAVLSAGLDSLIPRLQHFDITHENMIAGIADLYSQTLSKLTPKIMVRGDQSILSQSYVANEIRALLLAGIRSAMLWRQYGGSRLSLLLPWNKMPQIAGDILREL